MIIHSFYYLLLLQFMDKNTKEITINEILETEYIMLIFTFLWNSVCIFSNS